MSKIDTARQDIDEFYTGKGEAEAAVAAKTEEITDLIDAHTEALAFHDQKNAKEISASLKSLRSEIETLQATAAEYTDEKLDQIVDRALEDGAAQFGVCVQKQDELIKEVLEAKEKYLAILTQLHDNQHEAARLAKIIKRVNKTAHRTERVPRLPVPIPDHYVISEYQYGSSLGVMPMWELITDPDR